MKIARKRRSRRSADQDVATKVAAPQCAGQRELSGRPREMDRLVELINTSDAFQPANVLRRLKSMLRG